MQTRPLEKRDYDLIVQVIDRWWGGPTRALVHPIFFYELGDCARVIEDEGAMVGFLLAFIVPSRDVGYIHLAGVHPDYRRRGVARMLYGAFEHDCHEVGISKIKAIAAVGDELVQRFHQALGFDMLESETYAGPERPRVVFTKTLPSKLVAKTQPTK